MKQLPQLPGTPDALPSEIATANAARSLDALQFATRKPPHPPEPKPSYRLKNLDLPRYPGDTRRQSKLIPYEFEMSALCRDLKQFGFGNEVWRDHFGHAMLITMQPGKTVLPLVGPGHRHLRWTAAMVSPDEWKWLERGAEGPWVPGVRQCIVLVVIYRWDNPQRGIIQCRSSPS